MSPLLRRVVTRILVAVVTLAPAVVMSTQSPTMVLESTAGAGARAAAPTLTAPATADAGAKVRLRGRAPARSTVALQRQQAGRWVALGKARASTKGAWSTRVRFPAAGPTKVRAVVAGRASKVRTVVVYAWLDLARQPKLISAAFEDLPLSIGGEVLPHSIQGFNVNPDGDLLYLVWRTDRHCTDLRLRVGFLDDERSQADLNETIQGYAAGFDAADDAVAGTPVLVATWTDPVDVALGGLATADRIGLVWSVSDTDAATDRLSEGIGRPQARCDVASLPSIRADDVPPLGV
ncbi:hypothetical protein [Nocardioides sp.]|uniref:hypothetical protein n=1 Tax=Nocardioides sp. TaxID=35761 RepID=UPI003516AE26